MGLEEGLARVTLALLVLSILTSAVAITSIAHAQDHALTISPAQGPAGTIVSIMGLGFSGDTRATITFGETNMGTAYVSSMFGRFTTGFVIPSVPPGIYTVTATDDTGGSDTVTFTVTSKATPTPAPTPTATQAQPTPTSSVGPTSSPGTSSSEKPTPTEETWLYPTHRSSPSPAAEAGGFWSPPLVIGLVVVAAVAFLVPTTFLLRRRGNREMLLNEKAPPYRPESSAQAREPAAASRYNQPSYYGQQPSRYPDSTRYSQPPSYSQQLSRPPVTPRSGQPSSYNRQPSGYGHQAPFTKICPQCKRVVRDDYNLCPYCDKRLK